MFSTLLHMLDTGGQALLRIVSFWHYVFTRHPENPLWGPSVAIPIISTGGEESKDLNETWGYTKCYSRCFILTLWSMTLSLMVLESIIFFFWILIERWAAVVCMSVKIEIVPIHERKGVWRDWIDHGVPCTVTLVEQAIFKPKISILAKFSGVLRKLVFIISSLFELRLTWNFVEISTICFQTREKIS